MIDMTKMETVFPVLCRISPERRAALAERMQYRAMKDGEPLNESGPCQTVPFVLSGALRIFRVSETGREITLFRAEKGDACIIRMACGLAEKGICVQAAAQEPTELLTLSDADYFEILADDPAWKDYVIGILYERLGSTISVLEQLAFSSIDRRLANALYRMCGGKAVTVSITHEQMAAELGTVREVVSRLMGELKRRGVISIGHGKVTVLDPERLREFSR